jgi:hypothetical protein
MSDGCTEVCDKVIRLLKDAGFKISPLSEQSHKDVLGALDRCSIINMGMAGVNECVIVKAK